MQERARKNLMSQSSMGGLLEYLDNEQIMKNIGNNKVNKYQKVIRANTNISIISEKSQMQKNSRIPTVNKDYQFVVQNKSILEEQKKQLNQINQVDFQNLYDHRQEEDGVEIYKNWVIQTKLNIKNNQGKLIEQQYFRKLLTEAPKIESMNHLGLNIINANSKQNNSFKNNSLKQNKKNHGQGYDAKQKLKEVQQHKIKTNYMMIQVLSIMNILWNDFENLSLSQSVNSKLYLKLIISLEEDQTLGSYNCAKTNAKKIVTHMIPIQKHQIQDKKGGFKTPENYSAIQKFCLYFYTEKQNINLKIQMILYDAKKYQIEPQQFGQIKQQAYVVLREEAFSFVKIPMNLAKLRQAQTNSSRTFKRQFQKYDLIYSQDAEAVKQKQKSTKQKVNQKFQKNKNLFGTLNFKVTSSEYYKLLAKFIPSQYLVWHQDFIPGLLGNHLPKVDDMLFHISPSTQAKSLNIEIQNLQIQSSWFEQAKKNLEKVIQTTRMMKLKKQLFQSNKININFKNVRISIIVHNGIKQINRISSNLNLKMEIQKKMETTLNQNLYERQLTNQQKNAIVSLKLFTSTISAIPQVFNDENCFVIIQIQQEAQLKQYFNESKDVIIQQFLIPVGFTFFQVQKTMNNKPTEKRIFKGWHFDQKTFQQAIRYKKFKSTKTAKNLFLESFNNIFNSKQNFDAKSLGKRSNISIKQQFYSKLSMICAFDQPIYDETWVADKSKLQQSLVFKNQGLSTLMNKSGLINKEEVKIDIQKEKILKSFSNLLPNLQQPKFNKRQMKKIIIRDEITLLQNPESLYIFQTKLQTNKKMKVKQIKDLKEFLNFKRQNTNLMVNKNKLSELQRQDKSHLIDHIKRALNYQNCEKFYNYTFEKEKKQSSFYKNYFQFQKYLSFKSQNIVQSSRCTFSANLYKMFYSFQQSVLSTANNPFSRITQNNSLLLNDNKDNLSKYGYEKVPIQLIRTQLTQVNYNYLILINPISLKPLQIANNSFYAIPNKFFIKIYFWNMENLESPCLKIDPQTGEIILSLENDQNQNLKKTENLQKFSKKYIQHTKERKINKLKLKKIFHFQYGTEQKYSNSKDLFIDFIQYLYNGLMDIRIYDQFQQIGRSYVKLRNLIRKKRNQSSVVIEELVHSKTGPIFQLKIECKSLRKEKPVLIEQKQTEIKQVQQNIQEIDQAKQKMNQASIHEMKRFNQNKPRNKISKESHTQLNSFNFAKNNSSIFQQNPSNQFYYDTINSIEISEIKSRQVGAVSNKQKERIQRFKRQKQVNQEEKKKLQQESIDRIIERNYLISQYKYKVFAFRKCYLFVELQNRSSKKTIFYSTINDDDYCYYKQLNPNQQLKIIRNFHSEISQEDKDKILSVQANRDKLLKYKNLNSNYQVQLEDKEKIIIICQYQTKRKYSSQSHQLQTSLQTKQFLSVFNHPHTITISLLQSINQSTVSSIAKLHIYPEAIQNVISVKQTMKKGQKKLVCLPFLLSSIIKQKYQIYINQSRCNIICQAKQGQNQDNNYFNTTIDDALNSFSLQQNQYSPRNDKFVLASISNRDQTNKFEQKNLNNQILSIFGDTKKNDFIKQEQLGSPKKQFHQKVVKNKVRKQKQYNFLSLYLPDGPQSEEQLLNRKIIQVNFIPKSSENYKKQCQPIWLQICLDLIQAQQNLKIPLFETIKSKIKINNSWLKNAGRMPKVIGIVCEDYQFRTKDIWIQIDYSKSFTQIQFKYISTMYGSRSFLIKLIDPAIYNQFYSNALKSQAIIQNLQSSYLKRILYNIATPFPSLKTTLILNLPAHSKQNYQEPFSYSNSSNNKLIYHIYSTHPWLMCVDSKDKVFQIKAKTEKRLKLKINVKMILEQYAYNLRGQNQLLNLKNNQVRNAQTSGERNDNKNRQKLPVVVIGFVSQKTVEHFGFVFKII